MKYYKIQNRSQNNSNSCVPVKVQKNENCFGSDFEFSSISLLVMLKY